MVDKGLQPLCMFLAIFPSIVCVVVVSIPIWTRGKGKLFGIEDALLILATLLNLVLSFTTCGYISTAYCGYHVHDIPQGAIDPIVIMKWNYANSIIYNPILALVKASFLLALIKLRSQNKWINGCLWATLAFNGCFAIAAPLACILQCAYTVSTSSIVLATDVLVLLMPTWILHDLKMPFGRKMMVIAFLSFGIAVTVVGAVRTSVLVKVFVVGEVVPDPTYSINYTLSNIESGLAIIGTCGPTIKYLLGCCIPALRTPDGSSNRGYNYPSQGASQSRRHARGTRNDDTFEEIEENAGKSHNSFHGIRDGDVELGNVHCNVQSDGRRGTSEEQLVITKTVAWRVDASHSDSQSYREQNVNMPHTTL